MVMHRPFALFAPLVLVACSSLHYQEPSRDLSGSDDKAAAESILELLGAAGVPAEPASDGASVFVYRRGMTTLLAPIVQADGMDRVVSTRRYAPASGRSDKELVDLARRLNETLNVGVFSVEEGALVFQSQMTFIDRLNSGELVAFLGWLDAAELAIVRVDGSGHTLMISN